MKQKVVMKIQMGCDKHRTKALKTAAVAPGVISVKIDGESKDKLEVIGDGVDAVCLTTSLRKKVGNAILESVEEIKEDKKKPKQKEDEDHQAIANKIICYPYFPPAAYCELVCDPNPNPNSCSFM